MAKGFEKSIPLGRTAAVEPGQNSRHRLEIGVNQYRARRMSTDTNRSDAAPICLGSRDRDSLSQCIPPVAGLLLGAPVPLAG